MTMNIVEKMAIANMKILEKMTANVEARCIGTSNTLSTLNKTDKVDI